MKLSNLLAASFLTLLTLLSPLNSNGQKPPGGMQPPCCTVTAVDAARGLATARENATGRTFDFTLPTPALRATLKVGQGVYANFGRKQVSLDGVNVCCEIVSLGQAPQGGAPQPGTSPKTAGSGAPQAASTPCCSVVSIDAQTALVSAKVNATGQGFLFRPNDAVSLRTLKQGENIYANFQTKLVSLDGKNVSGTLVGEGAAPLSAPGRAATAPGALGIAGGRPLPTGVGGIGGPGGIGAEPCGVDQIPDVAGPIPPSTSQLDPLSAVNELQSIAWTNFSKQQRCDAVSSLLAQEGQNLGSEGSNDAGIHWSFDLRPTDIRATVDLAAAPGIRYACLMPQDCPPQGVPGFQFEVPLNKSWTIEAHAVFQTSVHVWEEIGGTGGQVLGQIGKAVGVGGGGNPKTDLISPCGFPPLPLNLFLSNIKVSETTIFDTGTYPSRPTGTGTGIDPSRPTVKEASAVLHMTLSLEGVIHTQGPQDLTLNANVKLQKDKPVQITFTNPTPILAAIDATNFCSIPIPAEPFGVGVEITWDPTQQQVTGKIYALPQLKIETKGEEPLFHNKYDLKLATISLEKTFSLPVPRGMLESLGKGLSISWGENPPSEFWTQPASASTDFAAAAKQIESAIPLHMPWGAILSVDHTHTSLGPLPVLLKPGQGQPAKVALLKTSQGELGKVASLKPPLSQPSELFNFLCPPAASARSGPFAQDVIRGAAQQCLGREADSAIWTGHYLAAEAFRYAATHSQDALVRAKQVLGGIQQLFWVTEDAAVSNKDVIVPVKDGPGLFARNAFPSNSPLPLGDSPDGTLPAFRNCYFMRPEGGWNVQRGSQTLHFATFGDIPQELRVSRLGDLGRPVKPQPVGTIWTGLGCGEGDQESPVSRDQYIGIFMGLAYAHALVPDKDVQKTTSDLITKALTFLIKNNWGVRVPPDRRIPLDSHFLRAWDYQLGFLRIGASTSPNAVMPNGATLAQLYRTYAAGSKVNWLVAWPLTLSPVLGEYFGFNLSHGVYGPTLLLESDPTLRQNFLLPYNMLRRATQHHKNAYFNALSMLVGAASPSQPSPSNPTLTLQDELKGILQEWLTRRDWLNAGDGLPFDFVGDPSYQVRLFNEGNVAVFQKLDGSQAYAAKYALPIYARKGDGLDFAWERPAFEIAVDTPSANPPLPPDYQLRPGDLLDIQVRLSSNLPSPSIGPFRVTVDAAGQITIPTQPPIPVAGLTVQEAQARVSARIGRPVSITVTAANPPPGCSAQVNAMPMPPPDYRLRSGDLLDIQAGLSSNFPVPSISLFRMTVDDAGQITIPTLTPIPVAGLTVQEAQARVSARVGRPVRITATAMKVVVTANQIHACGSDSRNQEAPGVDYLLPYWMGVYMGLLK